MPLDLVLEEAAKKDIKTEDFDENENKHSGVSLVGANSPKVIFFALVTALNSKLQKNFQMNFVKTKAFKIFFA